MVALAASSFAACGTTPATSNDPAPPGARPPPPAPTIDAVDLEQAQRAYIELRFGMFIHFGILDGLLDDNIVARLAEVGAAWSPDPTRPPLPPQGSQMERPYQPVAATATSGEAANAIDGVDNSSFYTVWESQGELPQSITIDLGQVVPDAGMLAYVPRYVDNVGPSTDGAITSYAIAVSTDGAAFTQVASGNWPADSKMKIAAFDPTPARYVRLDALAANGTNAAATEITVGASPYRR